MPEKQPHEQRMDAEKHIQRNPHGDFIKVQAGRPEWDRDAKFDYTKTVAPEWKLGDGANDGGESLKKNHIEIDPYADGRPAPFNYKLLISAIVPRPVGFLSTVSKDGELICMNDGWERVLKERCRLEHQPCALQLYADGQPRPTNFRSWLRRRHGERQGYFEEYSRYRRMRVL